ncbi:alpha/beta hydrolase-fold protein [Gramella jeungdoensis]|uniref:Alpha/beta hydrolase-fold protein n=1 Tax=Gramella jeungdoensis TaxID=708091 RepID=A0ABT0YXQ9_9FLAO|nr:alpha/beta hydrolase-fold protein [Gramella jeungdoensis]MCM8568249.1 alpha/beta hydrolase-fold protein [Gramella jeungdoensis]
MKNKYLLLNIFLLFISSGYAQSTASPQVKTFEIEAPQLDTIKKIWIYLPKSYENSDNRYPVIYMHDAQNLFDKETSFAGEWKVDEALDSISNPESIIVGIEHGGDKRLAELTPFPNEKYGGGEGADYVDFIISTLKPHIDKTFRTIPDQKNTAIFGSSLGGLISFYAALKHPETFGKAGVYSPSFWFSDQIYEFSKEAQINDQTKFYFLVGDKESEEMVPDLNKMIDILKMKDLKPEKYQLKLVPGGEHNEAMWSRNFPETFIWLMK